MWEGCVQENAASRSIKLTPASVSSKNQILLQETLNVVLSCTIGILGEWVSVQIRNKVLIQFPLPVLLCSSPACYVAGMEQP